jgi:hypothetical protein
VGRLAARVTIPEESVKNTGRSGMRGCWSRNDLLAADHRELAGRLQAGSRGVQGPERFDGPIAARMRSKESFQHESSQRTSRQYRYPRNSARCTQVQKVLIAGASGRIVDFHSKILVCDPSVSTSFSTTSSPSST